MLGFIILLFVLFIAYEFLLAGASTSKNGFTFPDLLDDKRRWPLIMGFTLFVALLWFNPIGKNYIGYRVVVESPLQSVVPNKVQFENGWYLMFPGSRTTSYPDVITIQYGTDDEEGDDVTYFAAPHGAKFSGGDDTRVGHTVKWDMPDSEEYMLKIHKHYRNHERLASTTLSQFQKETMGYSTQRMDSETHYSGGQSQLKEYFQDQLRKGQVLTDKSTIIKIDSITKESRTYIQVNPRLGSDGKELRVISDIQKYSLTPSFVSIDYVKYDDLIEKKLKAKIESATKKSISEQVLVTAQQEALTAVEEGKKRIAEMEATKQTEKLEAVINAQKLKEVAEQGALQAKFDAEKTIYAGKAQAEVDKLKNIAGLSPVERAQIDKETAIGVAAELAKMQFPKMMVIGGGGNGQTLDPFQAVGLESFLKISKSIGKD